MMSFVIPGEPNERQDIVRVEAMLSPFVLEQSREFVSVVVIDGEPRSKARPRFNGSGHAYVDSKQRAAEQELKRYLRASFPEPLPGNLAIACIFFRSSRHRIDCDNLLKHVLDAANTICWADDHQVTAVIGVVELDENSPRTVIAIGPHVSSMYRGAPDHLTACETCGKEFAWRKYKSHGDRIYCSRKCASLSRGQDLTAPATCLGCGKQFRRVNARQFLCSEACRLKRMNIQAVARRKYPPAFCMKCGAPVSRPEYLRCRPCFRGDPINNLQGTLIDG